MALVDDSIFGTDYDSKGGLTSTGDIALVTGIENAKQNIRNWLLTEKGFYPSIDDEYGSEIKDCLGDDLDDPNFERVILYIEDALYDNPRVQEIQSIDQYVTVKHEIILQIKVVLVNGSEEDFNLNLSEME